MLNEIAAALKIKDYKTAVRLIKPLLKSEPNNLWVQYYAGCVYEGTGKQESAHKIYRKILPKTTNPKLISLVRQGISRLQTQEKEERQNAIAQAKEQPGGDRTGVLILEPIAAELKRKAAQEFSKIMQIDPYIARLQLPSRGWRLYRTGLLGELQYYTSALDRVNIPCFCAPLEEIDRLEVLEVSYFQSIDFEIAVRCTNQTGQEGTLSFNWSEINQRVEGRLPIFESVVTVDAKHKLQRKTQTQDYAHFCDLHLLDRNCILRMCDRNYQFQRGISLGNSSEESQGIVAGTVSKSWQNLIDLIQAKCLESSIFSEFTSFAETAFGFREMLNRIPSCVELHRRENTPWDAAFQLYSSLAFVRSRDRQ